MRRPNQTAAARRCIAALESPTAAAPEHADGHGIERFRLRAPSSMGMRTQESGCPNSRDSGSPADSFPKTDSCCPGRRRRNTVSVPSLRKRRNCRCFFKKIREGFHNEKESKGSNNLNPHGEAFCRLKGSPWGPQCSAAPVTAQVRAILPVFWGISAPPERCERCQRKTRPFKNRF